MLNNNFRSNQIGWAYPVNNNWSRGSLVENNTSGYNSLQEINNVLGSAPSDVGGQISSGPTLTEIDTLNERRVLMKSFTDAIHYEVAERIDVPFSQQVQPIVEGLYELSPESFKTDDKFLWIFPAGKSLQNLLLGTIEDPDLKKSFKEQLELLDEDSVSDNPSLVDNFKASDFWAREFENTRVVMELTRDFMQVHEGQWETYAPDKQKTLLEKFATDIATAMGGQTIPITVNFDSSMNGFGSASPGGTIKINEEFRTGENPSYAFVKMINTVVHETRHEYQYDVNNNPDLYGATSSIKDGMDINLYQNTNNPGVTFQMYYEQPMEIDARAIGGLAQMLM